MVETRRKTGASASEHVKVVQVARDSEGEDDDRDEHEHRNERVGSDEQFAEGNGTSKSTFT